MTPPPAACGAEATFGSVKTKAEACSGILEDNGAGDGGGEVRVEIGRGDVSVPAGRYRTARWRVFSGEALRAEMDLHETDGYPVRSVFYAAGAGGGLKPLVTSELLEVTTN